MCSAAFFFNLSCFSKLPFNGLQVSLNKRHVPVHHGTRYNDRKEPSERIMRQKIRA